MSTRIKCRARRLVRDENGSMALFFAFGMMTMLAAVGIAVDMGRVQLAQAKLTNSLDAAGLAAGSMASTANVQTEAERYMSANFPSGYMNTHLKTVTATPSADNKVITLRATADLDTTFMRMFGINTVALAADSEITRANRGMELVLVLDVTGSMWSSNKYIQLRNASLDLISVLYGDKTKLDNVWVGIVPYVTTVNVGNDKTAWLQSYNSALYPAGTPNIAPGNRPWKGCMEERASPYDVNDDPPVAGNTAAALNSRFTQFFWPDTTSASGNGQNDNNWINDSGGALNIYDAVNYGDPNATTPTFTGTTGRGPNIGCGDSVLPFTSSRSTVETKINALRPWRRGGTMSNVGLVWGWRFLSPRWRNSGWGHELVNGANTLPLDYGTALMDKVVVLMTDGENQFYDALTTDPHYSDYTPYRRLNTAANGGRADINTTNQNTARVTINTKTQTICTAMKNSGIIIYTVTFQLGGSAAENEARTTFRNCASKPEYYFDAESTVAGSGTPDLRTVFKQIGDSLANLRISK